MSAAVMSASVLAFVPHDAIERAVTVLDIAVGRGLPYERAMGIALETIHADGGNVPHYLQKLIETAWRRRRAM